MNLGRVAAAAVTAWFAYIVVGYVVHATVLDGLEAGPAPATGGGLEPMVGFVVALAGFFAFAYTYAKGYEGEAGLQEGVRFGVLVAIMLISFALWRGVAFPLSGSVAAVLAIVYIVEFAAYGMIVGAIYKPRERRRRGGQ